MGRMFARDSDESRSQAFLVAPITGAQSRAERQEIIQLIRQHLSDLIDFGEVFYVSPDITRLMVQLADDLIKPPVKLYHFMPEDFPSFTGLVYFDGLIEIPTAYPPRLDIPVDHLDRLRAMVWGQLRIEGEPNPVGKVAYSFVDNQHLPGVEFDSPYLVRHWMPMHYHERFQPGMAFRKDRQHIRDFEEDDLTDDEIDAMIGRQQASAEKIVRLMYVWTQFLKTEILVRHPHPIDRQHEKMLRRSGRPVPPFRVVTLRRYAKGSRNGEGPGVEYDHRWKVRAHWRMQRVGPGRMMVRPTPVVEYWKGPEWAPKDERDTVQAVVR
jgi:hypothetical protein